MSYNSQLIQCHLVLKEIIASIPASFRRRWENSSTDEQYSALVIETVLNAKEELDTHSLKLRYIGFPPIDDVETAKLLSKEDIADVEEWLVRNNVIVCFN